VNRDLKIYSITGLLLVSLTFFVTFYWSNPPIFFGYALLISIYVFALFETKIVSQINPTYRHCIILLIVPLVPFLVVIDPMEVGLVGHDPYFKLQNTLAVGGSVTEFVDSELSFPLFFIFATSLKEILGISLESLAKYLPLIATSVPSIYYLGLKQYIGEQKAYLSGVGVASIQTFLFFHSMFHEESLAVTYFSMFILFTAVAARTQKRIIVYTLLVAVVFTHHYTAFMTFVFLAIWWVADWSDNGLITRLFALRPSPSTYQTPSYLVAAIISTAIVIYLLFPFAEVVLRGVMTSLVIEGPKEQEGAVVATSATSLLEIIESIGGRIATVLLVFVAFLAVISRKQISDWEFSWAVFGGGVAVIYILALVAGQLINLSATRFYFFVCLPLLPVAVAYLWNESDKRRQRLTYAVLIIFIIPQVFALAPALVYSDPSKGYVYHGHYTVQTHQATETYAKYRPSNPEVIGYEEEPWVTTAGTHFQRFTEPNWPLVQCENAVYIWKEALEREFGVERDQIEGRYNKFYSAGQTSLSRCRDPPGLQSYT